MVCVGSWPNKAELPNSLGFSLYEYYNEIHNAYVRQRADPGGTMGLAVRPRGVNIIHRYSVD